MGSIFTLVFDSGYVYSGLLAGGVVCGFNGTSGSQSNRGAFYFVKADANNLEQAEGISTEA